ncbi:MAG: hypothetical protein KY476_27045, partial [Planctomycetes bacterium]|nr:hypothetical protein [Planctomycetota bacterium]
MALAAGMVSGLGYGHNTRVSNPSSGTTELHVVIENAARISSSSGLLRSLITPSPTGDSNADQMIPETGVFVSEQATPTLLNNLLINLQAGLRDETPDVQNTIIGASIFQSNGNPAGGRVLSYIGGGDSNVGNVNDDFNLLRNGFERLFVDAADNVFTPSSQSILIDSAVDSLIERDQFASIKGAVGIPPSPILAPDRDVNGILRVDDPDVATPEGVGGNVFKDRGAVDRADFVGPAADLVIPQDNDPDGNDIDGARSVVQLTSGVFPTFEIQLTDGFEAADPFPGIGIDDETVEHTVIENGVEIHPAVTVFEDGRPLTEKIDYKFDYNRTSKTITLTPLAGLWQNDRVYVVRLNNEDRFVATIPSGAAFADADRITLTDAAGASVVFELETGFILQLPEPLHIRTPAPAATLDGRTFTVTSLTDGSVVARFEFDTDGVAQDADGDGQPDNIVIPVNVNGDTRDTLADKILTALQGAGIGVPQKVAGADIFLGLPFDQSLNSTVANFTRGRHPIIGDGETFTITTGGTPFTFEFDTDGQLTDADGDGTADNRPIILDGADTRSAVADKIIAALNAAGLNLDPDPTDGIAIPANLQDGRVQIGGLPGQTLDISTSPSLLVTGQPGVAPSTTLQLPGPLSIFVPATGGSMITEGDTFVIDIGGTPTTFEFDSDTTLANANNVAVMYTTGDSQNAVADALVTAISGALPGLSPVNQGG